MFSYDSCIKVEQIPVSLVTLNVVIHERCPIYYMIKFTVIMPVHTTRMVSEGREARWTNHSYINIYTTIITNVVNIESWYKMYLISEGGMYLSCTESGFSNEYLIKNAIYLFSMLIKNLINFLID